ncbi:MAG: class I SAM-dependent methyltransferase [Kiritimatiellales bacterium]|nr:class I SAM-dependent methyltransferase [Kiritimatiellota bacterium]MBL7011868.1 class I SAM-dependent methyltransferase [Kiritimatiellales bacterium]
MLGKIIESAYYASMFENVISKRAGLEKVTDAYRLVHRDEVGAFSVDRYGDWLLVTGYDEALPSGELLKQLGAELRKIPCKGGIVRTNLRDPHKRKLFSDLVAFGEPAPETYFVTEHGLKYEISLNASQHPGLFLDQRDSRRRVAEFAPGKRVANLFAFTCSFSVAALATGAEVAFSVDLAAGCLERGKRNFEINGLAEGGRGKFIKEDVRKWLARQVRKKESHPGDFAPWDVMICDPPVFAAAPKKGDAFAVEKEWPFLAESIRTVLAPGGAALFANNHRGGDDSFYYSTLQQQFSTVTALEPPIDFPDCGNPHVRTYWCS